MWAARHHRTQGLAEKGAVLNYQKTQKDHGVGHLDSLFLHVLHRFRGLNKFEAQMLGSRFSWGFNQHPKGDQPLTTNKQ